MLPRSVIRVTCIMTAHATVVHTHRAVFVNFYKLKITFQLGFGINIFLSLKFTKKDLKKFGINIFQSLKCTKKNLKNTFTTFYLKKYHLQFYFQKSTLKTTILRVG